uniref:cyclic pyranopterin monophosphate synthase n=1 Tax=Peronospora matthiolae TaxID=2874970 RepID=A0AAV1UVB6_9STRA
MLSRLRVPMTRALSSTSGVPWNQLTHVNKEGTTPCMVDVSSKPATRRAATARSTVRFPPAVLAAIQQGDSAKTSVLSSSKGPIITTAVIAGILGAKQTSALLPFCHPLSLENCHVRLDVREPDAIDIECHVQVTHKTGVEMEALTGASVAALCVYDMCKALSHEIVIEQTRLVHKTGGKRDVEAL